MRVDASKKGIILESWERFKAYCEGKYSDVIFRHLYMDRTSKFFVSAANFAEDIINDPTGSQEDATLVSIRGPQLSEKEEAL